MPKLFCIVQMTGGAPNASPLVAGVDYAGFAFMDKVGSFGAYLFSGTAAQLTALNALSTVTGIVAVTQDADGLTHWTELDGVITAGVRTKLNTWLTNRGFPTISAGQSYRTVITAIYNRINAHFDLSALDISE